MPLDIEHSESQIELEQDMKVIDNQLNKADSDNDNRCQIFNNSEMANIPASQYQLNAYNGRAEFKT